MEQIVEIGSRHVSEVFRARVAMLLPDSADHVKQKIEDPDEAVVLDGSGASTSTWANGSTTQQKPAGPRHRYAAVPPPRGTCR